MTATRSLDERLARYGDGIHDRLAAFPISRAHALTGRLRAFRDELVRSGRAEAADLMPPSADGGGQTIAQIVLLRTDDSALRRRYRAWQDDLRSLMMRLHTPATDPFVRTADGDRATSRRGGTARRSLPQWLTDHVAARDGDCCELCGVGPERPVEDPSRLVSGGRGGWYRVQTGPGRSEFERVCGRVAAKARAAQIKTLEVRFRVDHIIPAFHGGPNMAWNLQRLCKPCNDSKGGFVWPETLTTAWEKLEVVREKVDGG